MMFRTFAALTEWCSILIVLYVRINCLSIEIIEILKLNKLLDEFIDTLIFLDENWYFIC